ncbi:hypothetical protein OG568_60785 (plasmid) [Streptomyces sp. NBC_01450]|uniref:hypothetical protein n=1 Tax=Streptomyces sp. NBC_01450 TaxID=2903871 RepID=UPI002E2FC161|nr:hypothetical protein [Streptomyces sp. NBC_01450]
MSSASTGPAQPPRDHSIPLTTLPAPAAPSAVRRLAKRRNGYTLNFQNVGSGSATSTSAQAQGRSGPPPAFGKLWWGDHLGAGLQANFSLDRLPTTLTQILAAATSFAEFAGETPALKVLKTASASSSVVTAATSLVQAIRNGNVAPATANL